MLKKMMSSKLEVIALLGISSEQAVYHKTYTQNHDCVVSHNLEFFDEKKKTVGRLL